MNPADLILSTPLAFQVWDVFGWAAQALFAARVLHQWIGSERAGRSHVTAAFWRYSLLATPLLLVYVLHRRDPVFIAGVLVNGFLYARNLILSTRGPREGARPSPWVPVLLGLGVFGVVTFLSLSYAQIVSFDHPWSWLVVGFAGQALWSSRFVVQWIWSEKLGRSVLPPVFFWMSILGAALLFAWAVYRVDWVMMAAFALNPIPYVRNLILLERERRAAGGGGPGAGPRFLDAWGDPLGRESATRVGTFAFLLLVLVVALHDLGARSLHNLDLPRFGVLAREMIRSGEWLVPHRYGEVYANKPPLEIWLIAAPSVLFGEVHAFLVRLPSAIGLVLTVLATSAWGVLRVRSLAVGRAAALLLLGTYAITRFGREARPDMLATGLAVAGTVFLDRAALGRGTRRHVLLAGLLLGLALLAKGPVLLVLPLLVLLLPSPKRSTWTRVKAARPHLVLGVALGVAALWFVPAVLEGGWAYGRTLLLDQATERIGGTANHQEPWFYYARRLVDGGAPWTPVYLLPLLLLAWRGGRNALGGTSTLVLAALLALVAFSLVPTKHLRYVIFVFPLLGLAAAYLGVRLLLRPAQPVWSRLMLPAGGLLAAAAATVAVAGVRIDALVPVVVPALGLALLAVPAFGWRRTEPGTAARRRLLGSTLVAFALLLLAYWVIRSRYRERALERFDREVAAAVEAGRPVYTLAPLEPANVFHGLPDARHAAAADRLPSAPPPEGVYVLVEAARRAEVEARLGAGVVVLEVPFGDDGPPVLLLRYPPG